GRVLGFETRRDRGDFLLRLSQSDPGLQTPEGFDPPRTAILKFVAATLENVLHGSRHPELHTPTDESAKKALRCDPDYGVHNAIKSLRLPDDGRIPTETGLPE